MTEITKSPKHDENSSLSLISDLKKFFCEKLKELESNINNKFNTINEKLESYDNNTNKYRRSFKK